MVDRFGDYPGKNREGWKPYPGSGLMVSLDQATGLRSYLSGDRRYDEVVAGMFVGPEHWDYLILRPMVDAVLDVRWISVEDLGAISRKATHAGLDYANAGFEDGSFPEELLQGALGWIRERHGRGMTCLVHCGEGKSRSPFVVCLYLLPRFGGNLEETMRYVVSRRPEAQPARIYLDYLRRHALAPSAKGENGQSG